MNLHKICKYRGALNTGRIRRISNNNAKQLMQSQFYNKQKQKQVLNQFQGFIKLIKYFRTIYKMSSEELKEGLLLHLQTNRNFVEQKVYKQFTKECMQGDDLSTLNRKKMKQVIKFVFDFGSNEEMKPFYYKLQENIGSFIKQEQRKSQGQQKVAMDLQNLVELMIYCINNGFYKQKPRVVQEVLKPQQLIPVQEINHVQPKKTQVKKEQVVTKRQEKTKPQITLLNPQLQAKVDRIKLVPKSIQPIKAAAKVSTRLQIQKVPPKPEFKILKYQMPNLNVGPKYLQSLSPKPIKCVEPQQVSFEPLELQFLNNKVNRVVMRQRLYRIYQHYCSQQQNKGKSATFDKIKSQMQHMTIGKLLIFCKNSGLFKNSKIATKELVMSTFKRIAGGKQQIKFEQFQTIVKQIDEEYIKQIKNSGVQNLATFQARLKLNSNQGHKQFKKCVNMIFFTRDNKNKDNKLFQSKFEQRDLTSHSGKIGNQLKQQLSRTRQTQTINPINGQNNQSNITQNHKNRGMARSKPKTLNLQQIGLKQWPKIDWLQEQVLHQDQAIQASHFPKIERRKDIVGNLKKRLQQVSKMQIQH